MGATETSSGADDPCGTVSATTEAGQTVVSLFGEHDLSTRAALSVVLARAIGDDADVAIDLSGVVFMDASTIGVLVHTRSVLRSASRPLSVRDPSSFARFVLDLCELSDLVDAGPVRVPQPGGALASWIGVPAQGNLPVDVVAVDRLAARAPEVPHRDTSTTTPGAAQPSGADPPGPRESLHGGR
jgi:anti-anti-sigma factor